MKKQMLLCAFAFIFGQIQGQRTLELTDKLSVDLYANTNCSHCYQYAPLQLKISRGEGSKPELSLLKISETDEGPVTGGILHIMLVWGLDSIQEKALVENMRGRIDSSAQLLGALMAENSPEESPVKIGGKDTLAQLLRAGLKSRSAAANVAGAKMALSFRFDESQIRDLLEYIEKERNTDAFFAISLRFATDGPGEKRWRSAHLQLPFAALYPHLKS